MLMTDRVCFAEVETKTTLEQKQSLNAQKIKVWPVTKLIYSFTLSHISLL